MTGRGEDSPWHCLPPHGARRKKEAIAPGLHLNQEHSAGPWVGRASSEKGLLAEPCFDLFLEASLT